MKLELKVQVFRELEEYESDDTPTELEVTQVDFEDNQIYIYVKDFA